MGYDNARDEVQKDRPRGNFPVATFGGVKI